MILPSTFEVTERRTKTRFPIELVARYSILGRQQVIGIGRIGNNSRHGVLITFEHEVPSGTAIRVIRMADSPRQRLSACIAYPGKGCMIGPRPRCRAIRDPRMANSTEATGSTGSIDPARVSPKTTSGKCGNACLLSRLVDGGAEPFTSWPQQRLLRSASKCNQNARTCTCN